MLRFHGFSTYLLIILNVLVMKWLNIDRPLGSGNPYAPNAPCIWPAIIGAVGGIASAAIGSAMQSGFTKEQQRLQSKLNREEQAYSMSLQRGQQEWLMNRQYGAAVSGMKNAGLNPAMEGGGSVGAAPAAGHPSSGASGPSAGMPNVDLLGAAKSLELMQAQKENIEADTRQKEANTSNIDADTVIKRWQGSPQYIKLMENGMSADAAKSWASANLDDAQAFKSMAEVQKIGKEMALTDVQINNLQALTAKTYQDIQESISRVSLNKVEEYFKLTGAAKNLADAAKSRADAAEAHERINSGLYKSQANLNYTKANEAEANEYLLRQKGFTEEQIAECKKIEKRLLSFEDEVNQAYGATQKGSLQFTNDLMHVVLPGASMPRMGFSSMYLSR